MPVATRRMVGQSLWVFGGAGVVPGGSAEGDFLGDMWELNTQTKQWTYHGGALKANPNGNRTFPSARNYGVAWARTTDTTQPRSVTMSAAAPTGVELWMWGGVGVRFQGDDTGAPLNDTWVYSVDTHTWSQRNITPGGWCMVGRLPRHDVASFRERWACCLDIVHTYTHVHT